MVCALSPVFVVSYRYTKNERWVLHIAIAWRASPMSTARPAVWKSLGGVKSCILRPFISLSSETADASGRKHPAQVRVNSWTNLYFSSGVSGISIGEGLFRKPSRYGHETHSCPMYGRLVSAWLPGASRTSGHEQRL
jgi:hypothetical protein